MPIPTVIPTVTDIPKTTPSTRSRRPPPSGRTSAASDSPTVVTGGLLLPARRSRPAEYLSQVVLEVSDVVAHQVFERGRLFRSDFGPADLVEVMFAPLAQTRRFGRVAADVCEVKVVELPEVDEVRPRLGVIPLRA